MLKQQAHSLDLPLQIVTIPQDCGNREYDRLMREFLEEKLNQGVQDVSFGDVMLEDIRKYREARLVEVNMEKLFPGQTIDTALNVEQVNLTLFILTDGCDPVARFE